VVVAGNKAYAFGGFSATALSAETWIYDPMAPAGTRWTQGPDLSMARAYIASAVLVNRFIFAIGGDDWDGTSLIPQPIVERLDTQNLGAGWIQVADLPPASSGIAGCDENRAFGIGKYIVVAGCGQWNAVPSELVDCFQYDALADTWTTYPSLNEARRNHAGALVRRGTHTAFYVLGGRQETDDNILNSSEFTLP
jgi:N-acetylneuraminic acid mutarotase